MEDLDEENAVRNLYPVHLHTFGLPNDPDVRTAYAVYNPSLEALLLQSEKRRQIFPEVFITNPKLLPLSDLCTRAEAREKGLAGFSISADNPLKRRLQLDCISIDEPLENIYEIEDKAFWKRVALEKTSDATLKLKDDDYDWKSEGVTLKYIEIVEDCPAEYWPEYKMCNLAKKIKDHVKSIYIKKLQPLSESSFSHYQYRDSDTDKTTSTEVSETTTSEEEEIEEETEGVEADGAVEGEEVGAGGDGGGDVAFGVVKNDSRKSMKKFDDLRHSYSQWSFYRVGAKDVDDESGLEIQRLKAKIEKQKERRREERRQRRESQQQRRQLREQKRHLREEQRNRPKPKRIRVRNVFDLPVDEPEYQEHKQQDQRNLGSYLKSKQKNVFKTNRCHHIDLRFLGIFENLVSFHIEFLPPPLKANYHRRYFEFSKDDVEKLANGIVELKNLRIFRLRQSLMNDEKLAILVFGLNKMNVEIVDFGNDHLNDDCEMALRELFQNKKTIKSLELEGNDLGFNSMVCLGRSLKRYAGKLEYLGLARNPIGSEGLHALATRITNTDQVVSLCLSGIRITDVGMICCIGDELLKRHKVLRSLDISSIPLSSRSGILLVKRMRNTFNVLEIDCRGCDLDESVEMDIEICLRRNRYNAENPFVNDHTKTEADIKEYVNRTKNPILLAVNERFEKKQVCMDERSDIAIVHSGMTTLTVESPSPAPSYDYNLSFIPAYRSGFKPSKMALIENTETSAVVPTSENPLPFEYNVMEFNEKQLIEHVDTLGPANRFYYFKDKQRVNSCQND